MISDLLFSPLPRALKWLAWLIGASSFLLIGSMASFNHIENKAESVRLQEWKRIEKDTLLDEASKRAITVADLIRRPKKYHNKPVWVKGYLHLEFEGHDLFWRQVDHQNNKYSNSCSVNFADSLLQTKKVSDYSDHYVIIKGTFDTIRGYHFGGITQITSLNTLQKNVK